MAAELAVPHMDVGIVTDDREAAMAFWHECLGFPVDGEVSFPGLSIVRLKVGDAILRLCVPEKGVEQQAHAGAFEAQGGLRYLTLAVRNLDALVEAAAARGYPVPHPPREARPGFRVAQIQDGRGVTVELVEVGPA